MFFTQFEDKSGTVGSEPAYGSSTFHVPGKPTYCLGKGRYSRTDATVAVTRSLASLQTMKPLPGPSRLSQILQNLNKAPRATLTGVKSITLTLAQRNDHFGAR